MSLNNDNEFVVVMETETAQAQGHECFSPSMRGSEDEVGYPARKINARG
jgi:hypothetical protein